MNNIKTISAILLLVAVAAGNPLPSIEDTDLNGPWASISWFYLDEFLTSLGDFAQLETSAECIPTCEGNMDLEQMHQDMFDAYNKFLNYPIQNNQKYVDARDALLKVLGGLSSHNHYTDNTYTTGWLCGAKTLHSILYCLGYGQD
ncbi:hypothetical protein EB796_021304 [Bugula neritina]|uniref:Uncharacterized protein n=1 Tax=Bugula neritina TaxID=10212 RepID=A0A7J7J409_BUGNE|nr:hypothetical protein EB796_021304 [Bugula neritina]